MVVIPQRTLGSTLSIANTSSSRASSSIRLIKLKSSDPREATEVPEVTEAAADSGADRLDPFGLTDPT